jgi:Raf kinase inhibitor-like YbhB/YbcL family protein
MRAEPAAIALAACVWLSGCGSSVTNVFPANSLTVGSSDVGATFPRQFTCDGADAIPNVHWSMAPGAKEMVIEMTDPDAPGGTFTHWLEYGLPADTPGSQLVRGGKAGRNSFGTIAYRGPCPPPGPPHHYHLRVFALDRALNAPAGIDRADLDARMSGHVIATGELVATYQRG